MTFRICIYLFTFSFLMACASIEQKTMVSQDMGVLLTAGIGDTVYKSTTEKNLPNAFGKADLFGRTTPTGLTTVIYEGIEEGKALFRRNSTDIETGATAMNSTPIVINNNTTTYHNGTVGGTSYSGSSTSYAAPTIIPANPPTPVYTARSANIIAIDIQSIPASFLIESTTIIIHSANNTQTQFTLEE